MKQFLRRVERKRWCARVEEWREKGGAHVFLAGCVRCIRF